MYSRKKGKSGSTKPVLTKPPGWTRYKPKETELLIVKLSKEGKAPSEIGIILRDTYGVPNVKLSCNKKITKILAERKLPQKLPEDLTALIRKAVFVTKHREKNTKDMTAKYGLQLTESKIKRLVKYYKLKKVLPEDWKYERSRAAMLVE